MATYKHLSDLLKICSVLPALAIMPAMAENVPDAATSPDQVSNWSGHQYDMDDNQSREGGIIKISDQQWIEFIMLDPADGNTITLNKTEDNKNDVHGQGAILYNKGKIDRIAGTASNNTIINNSTVANKATANGGAFALYGGTDIGTIDVDFIKNSVQAEYIGGDGTTEYTSTKQISAGGGAIHIQGAFGSTGTAKIDKINGDFIGNSAIGDGYANGGAIYVKAGAGDRDDAGAKGGVTINSINGDFDGNFVMAKTGTTANAEDSTGGAISIKLDPNEPDADATVAITGDFRNNYVETNLTRALGGAIYNQGDLTVNGDFINNHVSSKAEKNSSGGAIYNTGKVHLTAGSKFDHNQSDHTGGAIYNAGELVLNNATFTNNHTYHSGGAIRNENIGTATITGSYFADNDALYGGAINNAATASDVGGVLTISDSEFVHNMGWNGGAIRNQGSTTIGMVEAKISGGKFTNNTSTNGGAIWNGAWGKMDIYGTEFVGNSATTDDTYRPKPNTDINAQGGAITNAGVLEITNATFTGNSAAKIGGAIANVISGGGESKVTLSGTNTFANNTAAGKANDIYNDGTMTVASGTTTLGGGITGDGTLTIANGATLDIGTTTVDQQKIVVDGTLSAQFLNENSYGRLQTDSITVGGNGLVNLMFGSAGTYDFGVTITPTTEKFAYNDAVYDVKFGETGTITVTTKSAEEIAQGANLSMGAANAINIMANAKDDMWNTISLRAQQDMVAGKTGNAEKELSKLNPDDKPVAQSVASSVQNQVLSLAAGRMSGASVGRSGGDLTSADYGMWVQGLYNHSKYNGRFSGDTMGISVGADTLIDGKYTLGIGYAYNDTDVDSNSRDTAIESHSVFLYGQYKPNEWYVNAALNYTMSNYTESADVYGVKLADAEYDVNSFGGQIMTGYDFVAGNPASIFTPEVGVRYLHVAQDAYQGTLGDVDALDTDYLTGVAGVKYAFEIESASELKFRPELRAAATYDFMSDAAVATVNAPGNVSYVIDADRLSRFGGEFGIGLAAQYRGLEVSLNYDLDLHEDYTSQTGMLKFRYDF